MWWWRRRERVFEVLGQRFTLPVLALDRPLERAARARRRLGATWFEALVDPLLRPLRSPATRTQIGFSRAHRVLSAHEQIVFLALDHVAIYDDALARATQHVAERARAKVDGLLARAAERRRVAERAAHLASRVESQLERDLALFRARIQAVARAAHLMLTRLARYRGFVRHTAQTLVEREAQLAGRRTLLVHDEHAWHLDRELRADRDFAEWLSAPDALCAGIEESLRGLVKDLEGLEAGLFAVPDAVDRLLDQAELADAARLEDPLAGIDAPIPQRLPGLDDVPVRLDDADWDALAAHELEAELVFEASTVEALGVEVIDWLARQGGEPGAQRRTCATCASTIVSGAMLGRAHVLCMSCRDRARVGGRAWLERVGFRPVAHGEGLVSGPVSRVVFESVMGWVPSAGPAHEPVTDVSWHEAIAFCNALSVRESRPLAYKIGRSHTRWLRTDAPRTGWRLPDAPPEALGDLREWLWGGADEAPSERLGPGLRRIAAPSGATRATAEAREGDVGFRVHCDRDTPAALAAPTPSSRPPRAARARKSPRVAPPRATRPALSPTARRRRVQLVAFGALIATAATTVALDGAGIFRGSAPRPASPRVDPATPPRDPASEAPPAPPAPAPVESPGDQARQEAEIAIVRGYSARAAKDRKAARAFFEEALALAPEQLDARYEAAREAAFARDHTAAFAHLDALIGAREREVAVALLERALVEPELARLRRDPRWKVVARALKKP